MSSATTPSNEALLRVRGSELVAPILSRIVGMLVARSECPIDTLDDALLLSDAIAAHAPGVTDGTTTIRIATSGKELALEVSPLTEEAGRRFVSSTALPDVGNVIERISDSVSHHDDTLRISLGFAS